MDGNLQGGLSTVTSGDQDRILVRVKRREHRYLVSLVVSLVPYGQRVLSRASSDPTPVSVVFPGVTCPST